MIEFLKIVVCLLHRLEFLLARNSWNYGAWSLHARGRFRAGVVVVRRVAELASQFNVVRLWYWWPSIWYLAAVWLFKMNLRIFIDRIRINLLLEWILLKMSVLIIVKGDLVLQFTYNVNLTLRGFITLLLQAADVSFRWLQWRVLLVPRNSLLVLTFNLAFIQQFLKRQLLQLMPPFSISPTRLVSSFFITKNEIILLDYTAVFYDWTGQAGRF